MRIAKDDMAVEVEAVVELEPLQPTPAEAGERSPVRRVWTLARLGFVLVVLLPTACATLYYSAFAADQYMSEARFLVRSPHRNNAGFLSGFLQSTGFVRAQDDSYAVMTYIRSRAAVDDLVRDDGLKDIFSRPEADALARFPPFWSSGSNEELFRHYLSFVSVSTDSGSGITSLETRAFRAEDARALAGALLKHAEDLVNRLNERARQDAIRYATIEVADGEKRLSDIQDRITDFRNHEVMIDPGRQSTAALDLIAKLTADASRDRAQLEELQKQAPQSPQIPALRARIAATESEASAQRAKVVGSNASIAPRISRYEGLLLERELATRMLASAATSLENAKLDAQRQQLYLERIVEPGAPDFPLYPKAIYNVLLVFGVALAIWCILYTLASHIFEHREV